MPGDNLAEPARPASATRLRVGVVLLLIWFLPFWALGPWIARSVGWSVQAGVQVGVAIAIVQTLIGIAGAYVGGKALTALVKGTPRKQVPARAWHILWKGSVEQ